MKTIKINLAANSYDIIIGSNLIGQISKIIKKLNIGTTALIVTSPAVNKLYVNFIKRAFSGFMVKIVILADGETAKSFSCLLKIINTAISAQKSNTKLFITALGGGTIGDTAGFAAAIYKRGVPIIQIPTTLLAQIDSGIGGKTAVNLPAAKNILGAIYQPKAVIIDTAFLNTLPNQEIQQGIAEAIKYGAIADKNLFQFLSHNRNKILNKDKKCLEKIIFTCAAIKAAIVEKDEIETKNIRTILNFGHTLGHAIETAAGYTNITHGQAIAIGMVYAGELSLILNVCRDRNAVIALKNLIQAYGLPAALPSRYYKKIYNAFLYDKKFIWGKVRMVLLKTIGKTQIVDDIPLTIIEKTLKIFLCRTSK